MVRPSMSFDMEQEFYGGLTVVPPGSSLHPGDEVVRLRIVRRYQEAGSESARRRSRGASRTGAGRRTDPSFSSASSSNIPCGSAQSAPRFFEREKPRPG